MNKTKMHNLSAEEYLTPQCNAIEFGAAELLCASLTGNGNIDGLSEENWDIFNE